MATAYINIGSNLGDSISLVNRAAELIGELLDREVRKARPYVSEPWGYESPNRYVNLGIAVDVGEMLPPELLHMLQEVERRIDQSPHRNDDGTYRDRYIDVDLIAVDGMTWEDSELQLPHPRMHLRDFVMVPMAELAPGWKHPLSGLTAVELAMRLRDGEKC